MTTFEALVKEAFSCPQREIDDFFELHFLKQLTNQLDGTDIPAEEIRHKRQQTNHIKNFLVNLSKK